MTEDHSRFVLVDFILALVIVGVLSPVILSIKFNSDSTFEKRLKTKKFSYSISDVKQITCLESYDQGGYVCTVTLADRRKVNLVCPVQHRDSVWFKFNSCEEVVHKVL